MDDAACQRPGEARGAAEEAADAGADPVAVRREISRLRERRRARRHAGRTRRVAFEAMVARAVPGEEEKRDAMLAFLAEERAVARASRRRVDVTDFESLTVIGRGSYGEVSLVRERDSGELFALKRMKKAQWLHKNPTAISARVRREREALVAVGGSEFVLKLHYAFQDSTCVYLVSDFASGGDLMGTLIHEGVLPERCVQYIAVELIEAISFVHRAGYVHRDIKPDNILINADGHIMLTDLGLARRVDGGDLVIAEDDGDDAAAAAPDHGRRKLLRSRVGTLDYLAPEILEGKPYSKEVDFWSLGAVLYECLVGYAPFCPSDGVSTRQKVARWRDYLRFPSSRCSHLSAHALSFVRALLSSQTERLGFAGGVEEIRSHAWLRDVDWAAVRSRSCGGPLVLDPSILEARSALRTLHPLHPGMRRALRTFLSPFADFLRTRAAAPPPGGKATAAARDSVPLERPMRIYGFTYKRHDPALRASSDLARAILAAATTASDDAADAAARAAASHDRTPGALTTSSDIDQP